MRIESDVVKTTAIVVILVGVYGGAVLWPSQKQNRAMAAAIVHKQDQLSKMTPPDLGPVRSEIDSLQTELSERSMTLPKGALDDRVLHHVSETLVQKGVTLYETSYRDTQTFMHFAMTPIDVRFTTDFVTAFDIIDQIESAGPPVRIERMDIIGDEGHAHDQVQVTIELSSFFQPTTAQGATR